jgi:hypothetical protein
MRQACGPIRGNQKKLREFRVVVKEELRLTPTNVISVSLIKYRVTEREERLGIIILIAVSNVKDKANLWDCHEKADGYECYHL